MLYRSQLDLRFERTYLVVQVFERECYELSLWNASYTEVEPCLVIVTLKMRRCVVSHPEIKAVLLVATLGSAEVTRAELAAEYNL